jgi:predicted dehydrogenase
VWSVEQVGIGIIGCGGFGRYHMARFSEIRDAKIVALCDIDPAQLAESKRAHPWLADVPEFLTHQEMIDAGGLDGVLIVTPHSEHFPEMIDCFAAGLHVLVEKPLCPTIDDCLQAMEARDKSQKVGLLSYQRHTSAEYRYLRNVIHSGGIGEIHYASAYLSQEWKRFTAGSWRQIPEKSCGGMLLDSGSHMLDALLWCSGLEPVEVTGYLENRGTPVEINSSASIKFKNGALGTLTVCGDAPGWREEISFIGDQGSILLRDGKITVYDAFGAELKVERVSGGSTPDRNFIDAILGRDTVQSPFEWGLKVTTLTQAVYRSAAEGRTVAV